MAREHGRKGALYVAVASGGTAQNIVFLNKWTADFTTDQTDVTSFDDDNKVYLAGLPDSKGTFGGYFDDASPQLYTAAQDGVPRKFYLYPSRLATGVYFFGTGNFDFHVEGGVAEAVTISGNWSAASNVIRVG